MKEKKDVAVISARDVGAIPRKISQREASLLSRFISFFVPRLRQQEGLALRAEEALIQKAEADAVKSAAEAEKTIEEAARIAAEKDRLRQDTLQKFNENLDSVFKPEDPREITMLKMAKLLEANPDLEKQLDRVNEIIARLGAQNGTRIAFKSEDKK